METSLAEKPSLQKAGSRRFRRAGPAYKQAVVLGDASTANEPTDTDKRPARRARLSKMAQRQRKVRIALLRPDFRKSGCLQRLLVQRRTYSASRPFYFAAADLYAGNLEVMLAAVELPGLDSSLAAPQARVSKFRGMGTDPEGVNLHSPVGVNLLWLRFSNAGPIFRCTFCSSFVTYEFFEQETHIW